MTERKFTTEQLRAINTKGADLLVSAAAGSGKTAVLVERVIKMLADESTGVDLSHLLVVTFTEAAAAEMRQRIRERLSALLKADPGNAWLRGQESQLPNSSIMTIHSFCKSVIRKYFYLTGIDPFFKVADATDAALLLRDAADELLEDMYTNSPELNRRVLGTDDNGLFLELVEVYGGSITDEMLGGEVIRLYEYSRGEPRPEKWLSDAARDDSADFEQAEWYKFLLGDVRDLVDDALAAAEKNAEAADSFLLHEKYIQVLHADLERIKDCAKAVNDGWDAILTALSFSFDPLYRGKIKGLSPEDEENAAILRENIRVFRDNYVKAPINTLRAKIFIKTKNETVSDLKVSANLVRGLCGLASELSRRFTAAKREQNTLDFSDLEHECIAILADGDGAPTAAAAELASHYKEIFIDEYQDSNAVQELLLSSVCGNIHGNARNLFMVGDVKQSIYRFRLADPEIFNKKYNSFSKIDGAELLITLSVNFRSRKAVLNSVNSVFSQILTNKLGGTDYKEDEHLHYGAAAYSEDEERHKTEVVAIESPDNDSNFDEDFDDTAVSLSKTEIEAKVTAKQIAELLAKGFTVTGEDGEQREARPSDIAILLRSPRNSAEVYVRALTERQIPAMSEANPGYFGTPEILTALSFLRVVDNPRQDIPLTAVLYSRCYGLSATQLLAVRGHASGSMYDSALRYLENGEEEEVKEIIGRFFKDLGRWREISAREGISAVTWAVLDESGQMEMTQGAAHANLRALYELAVDFENTRMRGLFYFIRYVDKIIKSGIDAGAAPYASPPENAVRIMSIHKSKGLEFPIVFVCGLGKKFNIRDVHERLLFHNSLGIGTGALDLERRVYSDTPKRAAISAKLRQEAISEELRVLYVAMTRAREKLILIGTGKKTAENAAEGFRGLKLPYRLLKKNLTFMDFLLQALARPQYADIVPQYIVPEFAPDNQIPADEPGERDWPLRASVYEAAQGEVVPRKLSVTEIKRLYYSEEIKESGQFIPEYRDTLPSPAFLSEKAILGAAERGTIFHTVMERVPFSVRTAAQVREFIASLTKSEILSKEEAATVDVRKIEQFLHSPLAERIRGAVNVWREQQFTILLPAREINPEWRGGEVMVHGVMDCIFLENDKLILVDYKTGRFTDKKTETARYGTQMEIYARAAKKHFKRGKAELYMYYFGCGTVLEL